MKIKKIKFHKICIKVHDDSNINNTFFVLFDLENVEYQQKNNKIAINISINKNNKMH